jgi:hypothetical protein
LGSIKKNEVILRLSAGLFLEAYQQVLPTAYNALDKRHLRVAQASDYLARVVPRCARCVVIMFSMTKRPWPAAW